MPRKEVAPAAPVPSLAERARARVAAKRAEARPVGATSEWHYVPELEGEVEVRGGSGVTRSAVLIDVAASEPEHEQTVALLSAIKHTTRDPETGALVFAGMSMDDLAALDFETQCILGPPALRAAGLGAREGKGEAPTTGSTSA
ncbi:MAG TPA: hypothetical protein VF746_13360 [Longimicrobium sp.]|jgi:hypothetical protein